jgi:hypothetical protein
MINTRMLAVLVAGVSVAGCSGEKAGDAAPAVNKAPVVQGADAVAAVLQSSGTPLAKLGFVVATRPVAGMPLELRLDLSSASGVPAVQVRVEAQSFAIDPATAQVSVAVEAGRTVSHHVNLTPQKEGLAEVTVRLRSADSAETVYAIPVLVAAAATSGG